MSKNAKVWTALVTVYIIWGSTYLGIFYAGQTIPPLFAASTRFITAGTLMALFVKFVRRGSLRAPRRAVGYVLSEATFFPKRRQPAWMSGRRNY